MLKLIKITKDYLSGDDTVHALRGIDICFRKSEFVSILGPSGCGKTTLMNIIGGLDHYTSGDLLINGRSTSDYKDSDWDNYRNKKIGFIFQNYNLIQHLDVLGNVEIALTISGISVKERKSRAIRALQEVGLDSQIHKKPNQLSGGQMQRVAIARALVNEPEILLADEPTGALDSRTSEQIMSLISTIAKNRLVIMVTHNPDLAKKYSSRIVRMLDGKITEDSMPFDEIGEEKSPIIANASINGKKSKMSFLTSLSLSWKNLKTKRGRTIMTSIAGSIGIIGVSLILALSNGMNNYVSNLQSDMLSSTPISISSSTIDVTQAMKSLGNQEIFEEFPDAKKIFVEEATSMSTSMIKNDITQDYIDYINENLSPTYYNDIMYKNGQSLNFYGTKEGQTSYSKLEEASNGGTGMMGMISSSSTFQLMLKNDFVNSQYDVLEGNFPSNKNELAIIVSSTNQIPESTLVALGIKNVNDETKEYDFSSIVGREYKWAENNLMYDTNGSIYFEKSANDIDFSSALTLTISGILRVKETVDSGSLSTGIGYTNDLYTYMQNINNDSNIVKYMDNNIIKNPFTGIDYEDTLQLKKEEIRENTYRGLGGESLPNEINIYPVSFETKNEIKTTLDQYNVGKDESEIITYSDLAALLGNSISSIINVITYVLIGFTAISLLVSCIMIAIITFVSVLERTKEIGILRSIGARKKDVTSVFIAETFIIGLIAGLIGVGFTYLISIPINLVVFTLLGVSNIANLNVGYAIILILISVGLTVFSGLIPSRKASRQDPVVALRTE